MKRLINPRLAMVCLLPFIAGTIVFKEILFENFWPLVIFCVAIAALAILSACLGKRYWILCIAAFVFLCLGAANLCRVYFARQENTLVEKQGVMQARVTDIGRNGNAQNTLWLENCVFEGQPLQGRTVMYVVDGEEYQTGDIISCFGTLRNVFAIKDSVATNHVRNHVRYELSDAQYIVLQSGKLTVAEQVRKYVFDAVQNHMPQNADVAYALLTGDRNALGEEKTQTYVDAGIIHLLVVSGLHVGFVVSVFGFFLKRLRLPVLAELALLLVPLLFYAYVCDFAPSVMRALVMTVCLQLSRFARGRYDLLSSLCWAMLTILVLQPLYLFDVGFQLSVLSVFGIATLYLAAERTISHKMPKLLRKVTMSLVMSACCVASTLFLSAHTFQGVAMAGLLVNVVAIPLVFVAFVVSVCGMLPWVFHYLLWLADQILQGVTIVANWAQSLNSTLPIDAVVWAIPLSVVLLLVLGGYVNFSRKVKWISCLVCALLLSVCVGVCYLPKNTSPTVQVFVGRQDSTIVAACNDEVAVVGSFEGYSSTLAYNSVSKTRGKKVSLYFTNASSTDMDVFLETFANLQVQKVYFLDDSGHIKLENFLQQQGVPVVRANFNDMLGDKVTVQSVYDGGLSGVVVKTGKISVALVLGEETKTKNFALLRSDVAIYVVSCAQQHYSQQQLQTISYFQQNCIGNFGANRYGNFTITEKYATIVMNFRRSKL